MAISLQTRISRLVELLSADELRAVADACGEAANEKDPPARAAWEWDSKEGAYYHFRCDSFAEAGRCIMCHAPEGGAW